MTDDEVYQIMAAQYAAKHLSARAGAINVSSLARTDNYRGKYPHMGPRPEWVTEGTVTDGARYPLTNKLDYVFFKRTMIQQPDGSWKQRTRKDR